MISFSISQLNRYGVLRYLIKVWFLFPTQLTLAKSWKL